MLLSSHILAQVEALADRISIIRKGKIVETETLAEIRHISRTAVSVQTATPIDGLAERHGVHALTATPPTLEQLLLRHFGDIPASTS